MSDVINGVPRELLERTIDRLEHGHEHDKAVRELRALLTAQPQASAAQSSPAGGRDAVPAEKQYPSMSLYPDAKEYAAARWLDGMPAARQYSPPPSRRPRPMGWWRRWRPLLTHWFSGHPASAASLKNASAVTAHWRFQVRPWPPAELAQSKRGGNE